ncbi:putative GNAT family acetyltransferase [Paraphoma chrysanthemicola]|nr:putative GNAT family acetyltransferase [Paraphoma chrysanthemicola]
MEYSYIRIDPESQLLSRLAQNYKALRLSALQQSPSSFSSTYDIESRFPDEWWESRLQIPGRETFICVANGASSSADEWVAQVTLIGPVPASSYRLPEAAQQPPVGPDEEEEKWQMLSLYTLPTHRGKGIAKALCREAFQWLQAPAASKPRPELIRVRIMVKPENVATVQMYQSLGFTDAGRCTLAEALVANGDEALVPADGGGDKFQTRAGLIMSMPLHRHKV